MDAQCEAALRPSRHGKELKIGSCDPDYPKVDLNQVFISPMGLSLPWGLVILWVMCRC